MKALIIVAIVGVAIFIIVSALGSTLGDPEYGHQETNVTGPLAKGNVSEIQHSAKVWRIPRPTQTRKDREEMLVGVLNTGDVFLVKKHVREGAILWVNVVAEKDPNLTGWLMSPPEDPIHARTVR